MKDNIIIYDIKDNCTDKISPEDWFFVDANLAYATCKGCFGCWLKNPSKCVMKDKLENIGSDVCCAKKVIVVSRCVYGGLSPQIKKIWDRCIPGILPFFRHTKGKMHHALRYENSSKLIFIFYGDISEEEKLLAQNIAYANGINFGCDTCQVEFFNETPSFEQILKL